MGAKWGPDESAIRGFVDLVGSVNAGQRGARKDSHQRRSRFDDLMGASQWGGAGQASHQMGGCDLLI